MFRRCRGVLRSIRGCSGCFVLRTAQVELRSGRPSAPAGVLYPGCRSATVLAAGSSNTKSHPTYERTNNHDRGLRRGYTLIPRSGAGAYTRPCSAQPKPLWSNLPRPSVSQFGGKSCTQHIPQNVLTLSRHLDECKPLVSSTPRTDSLHVMSIPPLKVSVRARVFCVRVVVRKHPPAWLLQRGERYLLGQRWAAAAVEG